MRSVYDRIVIPEAVLRELHGARTLPDLGVAAERADWIDVRPIGSPEDLGRLSKRHPRLDAGEVAAMVLAPGTEGQTRCPGRRQGAAGGPYGRIAPDRHGRRCAAGAPPSTAHQATGAGGFGSALCWHGLYQHQPVPGCMPAIAALKRFEAKDFCKLSLRWNPAIGAERNRCLLKELAVLSAGFKAGSVNGYALARVPTRTSSRTTLAIATPSAPHGVPEPRQNGRGPAGIASWITGFSVVSPLSVAGISL